MYVLYVIDKETKEEVPLCCGEDESVILDHACHLLRCGHLLVIRDEQGQEIS